MVTAFLGAEVVPLSHWWVCLTHLLLGLLTMALEMFWSMKKSSDRQRPRPALPKMAPTPRPAMDTTCTVLSSRYSKGATVGHVEGAERSLVTSRQGWGGSRAMGDDLAVEYAPRERYFSVLALRSF